MDDAAPGRRAAAWIGRARGPAGRPAPLREPAEIFESAAILHPTFSPHAFIETRYGTIEVELNVVEAPLTTRNFVELARAGFFNGVRGPSAGARTSSCRRAIRAATGKGARATRSRDELSPLPYVRGTVGMALAGPDTGGSQFFITVSPQPHLDGKYTVFGRVVQGMEILDRISQWDVIERVRIWDGVTLR